MLLLLLLFFSVVKYSRWRPRWQKQQDVESYGLSYDTLHWKTWLTYFFFFGMLMCFFFQFLSLFWKSYPSIHAPHSRPLLVGFATLISYYSHKNSYFRKTFCQKNSEVISASVHWTNHINENAVTRVFAQITYKMYLFWINMCWKISLKVVYWWIVKN